MPGAADLRDTLAPKSFQNLAYVLGRQLRVCV